MLRVLALAALAAVNLVLGTVAYVLGDHLSRPLLAAALPSKGAPTTTRTPRSAAGELSALAAKVWDAIADVAEFLQTWPPKEPWTLVVVMVAITAPALIAAPAIRMKGPASRRSLALSVAGAATVGGACAVGILATLWDVAALMTTAAPEVPPESAHGGWLVSSPWLWLTAWAISGTLIALLLRRAGCAKRPDRVDQMVRWIFAGTCVELAIAAPTLVAVLRRSNCACSWGSWWAIVAGTTTLGVMCGPALLLLATRRSRMRWMREACRECGYPRRGGGTACPECGKPLPADS